MKAQTLLKSRAWRACILAGASLLAAGTSSTQTITITPVDGSVGTFHLCAIANRIVPETARK
ncbi:MAG: hypothetical protein RL088_4095 [Verrucomicrobiota bacterium]|jgi:hypothetical protein